MPRPFLFQTRPISVRVDDGRGVQLAFQRALDRVDVGPPQLRLLGRFLGRLALLPALFRQRVDARDHFLRHRHAPLFGFSEWVFSIVPQTERDSHPR